MGRLDPEVDRLAPGTGLCPGEEPLDPGRDGVSAGTVPFLKGGPLAPVPKRTAAFRCFYGLAVKVGLTASLAGGV